MATMVDIARRAGVSVSTVSYVLSGKRAISDATRNRVLAVMAEAGYAPNAFGQALAERRSRTIALLFPAVGRGLSEMDLDFVTNAAAVAGERGYAFSLSVAPSDDLDIVRLIQRGRFDGVILMEVRLDDSRVPLLRSRDVPFTLIGHCADNAGISFVDLDFAQSIETAVGHLADLGHHRIALVNSPAGLLEAGYGPAMRSLDGFTRAVAARGLAGVAQPCEAAFDDGAALLHALMERSPRPSALIVTNLDALGGVVQAARERGLAIPADLSLVAVASERLIRFISPALTTVEFPAATMGRLGAELLIRQLEDGAAEPVHHLLPGDLTVRRSTGAWSEAAGSYARPVAVAAAPVAAQRKGHRMQATTMTRRTILGTGAGLTAAALLGSTRRARAQDKVTLTWWDYYDSGANADAAKAQIARYMESHPNVQIDRTAIPFADLKQKLLQGATAGQLPDIAIIDNPDHQSFAALGVLADISDRVKAWGQADKYFEGPWNSTLWQGKNYGIPDNSNCLVLWRNLAFSDPAEVKAPETWDELTAAAKTLTSGDRFGLAVCAVKSEEGTFQWLPFLWETGEDIPTIDSDGGKRALQLWVDLVNAGSMSKGILGWTQQDVLTQFQNGKAAMMVNGPWQIPVLKQQNPDLKWEVSVLPKDKQGASILGGENYALTANSNNLDAAWDFLTWAQQPDNLKRYLQEAGKLPSRADLATDAYWTGDPVLKVFVEQLKVAKPRAYGPKYPEISNAIQLAIQGAVSGQSPVDAALSAAQATITPLLPQ